MEAGIFIIAHQQITLKAEKFFYGEDCYSADNVIIVYRLMDELGGLVNELFSKHRSIYLANESRANEVLYNKKVVDFWEDILRKFMLYVEDFYKVNGAHELYMKHKSFIIGNKNVPDPDVFVWTQQFLLDNILGRSRAILKDFPFADNKMTYRKEALLMLYKREAGYMTQGQLDAEIDQRKSETNNQFYKKGWIKICPGYSKSTGPTKDELVSILPMLKGFPLAVKRVESLLDSVLFN